jgi:hypothetical protein
VVVDDNPKQLQIWEKIADKAEIDFSGYLDPRDVEKEVSLRQNRNKVIFVFDFSLGLGNKNGLEWIESLDLGRNAILSTHFSESIEIQSQCIEKKIPLLPKQWVSWLPIVRRLPHGFSEPLPVKLSGNTVPVTISS